MAWSSNYNSAISFIFILLFLISANACGTAEIYEGENINNNNVVLIKATHSFGQNIYIERVNGEWPGFAPKIIKVLPGEHALEVRITKSYVFGYVDGVKTLTFNAVAGETYYVDGYIKKKKDSLIYFDVWAWIANEDTDEIVAGELPE